MWRVPDQLRHRSRRGQRGGIMRGRLNRRCSGADAGFCWLVLGEKQVDPCRGIGGRWNAGCYAFRYHDRHRRSLTLVVRSHHSLHRQLCHSWTLQLLVRFRLTLPSHHSLRHLLRDRLLLDN